MRRSHAGALKKHSIEAQAAQASIRILEIQRDRTRETMLHAQANSALMEIHAPLTASSSSTPFGNREHGRGAGG